MSSGTLSVSSLNSPRLSPLSAERPSDRPSLLRLSPRCRPGPRSVYATPAIFTSILGQLHSPIEVLFLAGLLGLARNRYAPGLQRTCLFGCAHRRFLRARL